MCYIWQYIGIVMCYIYHHGAILSYKIVHLLEGTNVHNYKSIPFKKCCTAYEDVSRDTEINQGKFLRDKCG